MDTSDKDYLANTSTTGKIVIGATDYGVINTIGDSDWFKVSLSAGTIYRFTIEAGTINGLFDPQLAVYDMTGTLLSEATTGQGFQLEYIDFTPTSTANYFLSASGHGDLTGSYKLITYTDTSGISSGAGGDDSLSGTSGADYFVGGAGNDTYVVNHSDDIIVELAGEGIDTVNSTLSKYTLTNNVENLELTGMAAINGSGNTLDNNIKGNTGNNALNGLGGNDTLDGGEGNDIITAGFTSDTSSTTNNIVGGSGNDKITVIGLANNTVYGDSSATDATGDGNDNIATGSGADYLYGAGGNDKLSAGAGDDFIFAGSGNDTLDGGAGNDYLVGAGGNDVLNGGEGNDTLNGDAGKDKLAGGKGDDTYYISLSDETNGKVNDVITEKASEGTDSVLSSISYILNKEVENLTLNSFSGDINGVGNAGINTIVGNEGANTLNGKEGMDILTGGAGNDIFKFDTKLTTKKVDGNLTFTNVDTITDFKATGDLDVIYLDKRIFSKAAPNNLDTDKTDGLSLDVNDIVSGVSFGAAIAARAGVTANAHFLFDSTGALYYDADGSGGGKAIQFATLTGVTTLAASDLHIV